VFSKEDSARRNVVVLKLALVFINDDYATGLVENDAVTFADWHETQADVTDGTVGANLNVIALSAGCSNTTNVEGTHGELSSRLTDGLSGDDTDCGARLHYLTCGRIDTIGLGAQAVAHQV